MERIYEKKLSNRRLFLPGGLLCLGGSIVSSSILLTNPHILGGFVSLMFTGGTVVCLAGMWKPFIHEVWVTKDAVGWKDKGLRNEISFVCQLTEIEKIEEPDEGNGRLLLKDGSAVKLPTILWYSYPRFKKALNEARPDLFTAY